MLGGTAEAVVEDYNCMLRNPANLGFIDKTVFSSVYLFDVTRITEGGAHANFIQTYPDQISIGIPVGAIGTIGLSYTIGSNAEAKFRPASQSIGFDTSSVSYQPGLAMTGGITSWQVGWGRELPRLMHLRIGAGYERMYVASFQTIVRSIADVSRTVESRDSTAVELRANGLRGGLMLPLGKFKVGFSGEYFIPEKASKNNAVYSSSSDTTSSSGLLTAVPIDEKNSSSLTRIPPIAGMGASYMINAEWLAAADVSATFWNMYYSQAFRSVAPKRPAISFSAGAHYVPAPAMLVPKYWETIHYGAGFRYAQLPADESDEYAVSLGTGLPIGRGRGLLTLGFEIGRRTDGHYPGFSENFLHFAIGVNGSRKWNKSTFGNY